MSAFFFGPAERQIFGCYHAPRGAARGAAVICPSWGSEYQYAHRALRVAARRLAERGVHVLRFDYSGTGDSWGETTDADMEEWQTDVDAAIDEVKAMSGQHAVDLIGLRLGALVAARAAARRPDVGRVVLWDPVTSGPVWVSEIQAKPVRAAKGASGAVEFGQRLIMPALLGQFNAIEPAGYPDPGVASVFLLQTRDASHDAAESLRHVSNLDHRFVEDASPWLADTSIWSGLVPVMAVGAIVDWIGTA